MRLAGHVPVARPQPSYSVISMDKAIFVAVVDESQAARFVAGFEAMGVLRTKLELPEKIGSGGCGARAVQ
jgi:hypothetical protein